MSDRVIVYADGLEDGSVELRFNDEKEPFRKFSTVAEWNQYLERIKPKELDKLDSVKES